MKNQNLKYSLNNLILLTTITHKKEKHFINASLVTPEGFEPPTVGAEIQYSIQLNYGAILCSRVLVIKSHRGLL